MEIITGILSNGVFQIIAIELIVLVIAKLDKSDNIEKFLEKLVIKLKSKK